MLNNNYNYNYFFVQVCNKGKAAVVYAKVDLYFNRSTKPSASTVGDKTYYVSNLNPGACQQPAFYTVLAPGKYSSWAYVDRTNLVVENDETNNVHGPVKQTVAGTGKPDLQITNVSLSSNTSGNHYYNVTLCNKGTATAMSTKLEVYYDRSTKPPASLAGDYSYLTGTLYAGACTMRTVDAYLSPGSYTSWFYLDRSNAVIESNEANNVHGPEKITVGGR